MLQFLTGRALRLLLPAVLSAGFACEAQAQSVSFFKNGYTSMESNAFSITQAPSGSIYIAGTACATPTCVHTDALIVKTNTSGDTLWMRTLGTPFRSEEANKVLLATPEQLLIAGHAAHDNGISGILYSVDTNGVLLWQRSYLLPHKSTGILDMKRLSDGIAMCGFIIDEATENVDGWLLKTDLEGNMLWHESYGGENFDIVWQMEHTAGGGFLLGGESYSHRTGTRHSDAWLIKTNSMGEEIWIKNYGNADTSDMLWSIAPAGNELAPEGYVFTGVKNRSDDNAFADFYLSRVDTSGNVVWALSLASSFGFMEGRAIERAPDGTFYVFCSATSTSPHGLALLLIHVNADGVVLDTFHYTNPHVLTPGALFIDTLGSAYVAGTHTAPLNQTRAFLARITGISHTATGIAGTPQAASFSLSPNPATDVVMVRSQEPMQRAALRGVDGRLLRAWPCSHNLSQTLPLHGIQKGLYFLTVYHASGKAGTLRLLID